MPRQRIILAVSPQKLKRGVPPDEDVNGLIGRVRFERGVSEVVDYTTARQFSARGNVTLPPDEARARVEEIRGETDESGGLPASGDEEESKSEDAEREALLDEELEAAASEGEPEGEVPSSDPSGPALSMTPAALENTSLPDEVGGEDLPGYHEMLTELSEVGLSPHDFFGGQPEKEPLKKLYVAYTQGPDALE